MHNLVRADSVAGVHAPALVERFSPCPAPATHSWSVAGVHAPALVERIVDPWVRVGEARCRRGSRPGLG